MGYLYSVRTTLELDDDLLVAAKNLARQQGTTLGEVISALARQSLPTDGTQKVRNGVPLFVSKALGPVSDMAVVNKLRDGM